ncbi:MAG: GNAT family N-acetyltransferase [Balneolaceae bacterium]
MKPITNEVTIVSTQQEKKNFLRFPYHHYEEDPYWVPPLMMDQKKLLNKKKNPFYNQGEIVQFLAERNGIPSGRLAAIIDHRYNEYHNTLTGFFGFYESIDSQDTTDLLFRVASDWLRDQGMKTVLGPANPGMMDEIGILVEGFESYPYILMPWNKPYYDSLLKGAGFSKATDLYAYEVTQDSVNRERMHRAVEIVKKRMPDLHIRELNMRNLKSELVHIRHIFNESWKDNWGFVPITEEEFQAVASDLKMIVDTKVAHIAELNGQPVAFSIALPDYNQVFRKMDGTLFPTGIFKLLYHRRYINRIRTALMGVLPEYRGRGIDALLHQKAIQNGKEVGYYASELSWILESNVEMIRVAEKIGGYKSKTYRMYQMDL